MPAPADIADSVFLVGPFDKPDEPHPGPVHKITVDPLLPGCTMPIFKVMSGARTLAPPPHASPDVLAAVVGNQRLFRASQGVCRLIVHINANNRCLLRGVRVASIDVLPALSRRHGMIFQAVSL
jgi:hypothetical protein